ncbi:four helix bundle protein [Salinibacter ruber]|uniref:four helix bundle protein n=1 Tax=Salinibacter ruber TaxID=146919 RepID=UPI00160D2B08|nr:four helix bundle protein [Salinibacter ruber]MBB4062381.1 four helix bundle protein [Salinibacter ruber]
MAYKFEQLDVWERALDYIDQIHEIADELPKRERYNLGDQMTRAANSIALNIAEGSTGQSDAEQDRFLRIAIRSLLETVAGLHLVKRRGYLDDLDPLRERIATARPCLRSFRPFALPLTPTPPFERSLPNTTAAFRSEHISRTPATS